SFARALGIGLLLGAVSVVSHPAGALANPSATLASIKSGNDLILSFPTTGPYLYMVQTTAALLQPWTDLQSAITGDGTVKMVTITNGLSGDTGFYRLSIQTPLKLLLPQSNAFDILGHSCGGIKEQVYVTGFDSGSTYVTGDVYLSTTCS